MRILCGLLVASVALLFAPAQQLQAAIVTQWNFNSVVPNGNPNNGNFNPNIGTGDFTTVGTTSINFRSGAGSSDPAPNADDSALNVVEFGDQGTGDGANGIQFNVSTVGQSNIVVSYDQRFEDNSSGNARFEYTTDGTTFTSFATYTAPPGGGFLNGITFDLSGIAAAANNALFGFRVVSIFAPTTSVYTTAIDGGVYDPAAGWRFDMVTVSAVPEPGSIALLSVVLTGAAGFGFRARRKAEASPASKAVSPAVT